MTTPPLQGPFSWQLPEKALADYRVRSEKTEQCVDDKPKFQFKIHSATNNKQLLEKNDGSRQPCFRPLETFFQSSCHRTTTPEQKPSAKAEAKKKPTFMGKILLLQGGSKLAAVQADNSSSKRKQQTNLFLRVEKPQLEKRKIQIKIAGVAESVNAEDTHQSAKEEEPPKVEEEQCQSKAIDDDTCPTEDAGSLIDDLSSLSSLQSDDDVLGPWINDSEDENEDFPIQQDPASNADDKAVAWCAQCDALNQKEEWGPFEIVTNFCSKCHDMWSSSAASFLGKLSKHIGKKRGLNVISKKHYKKTSVVSTSKGRSKRVSSNRAAPPPTKSRGSRKHLGDLLADVQKDDNIENYVTTGAFMTRRTAKQLADPQHGFRPNPYNLYYGQKVEVLNLNGHWYQGVLTMMQNSKVKVTYTDWRDQEEWIIMGSRRLKVLESSAEDNDEEEEDKTVSDDETVMVDPLLPQPKTAGKQNENDYVSDVLDTDPSQIFNDTEIFLTRRMAKELTDEHGFRANAFGYRYNRAVAVSFKGVKGLALNRKLEYLGYLREMRGNQVRIWYPTLRQSDWLVVGSRRLRLLTAEEEEILKEKNQLVPPEAAVEEPISKEEAVAAKPSSSDQASVSTTTTKRGRGRPRKQQAEQSPAPTKLSSHAPVHDKEAKGDKPQEDNFLTTGAFATRRAMRQLKDEHGFVPNPYGYYYNQPVEVLNTRTAKTKFWERAHLVAMRPGQVKVHYDGWSEVYDEWFTVGSRRIRPVSATDDRETSVITEEGDGAQQQKSSQSSQPFMAPDMMTMESNPEISEEARKKRRRVLLGPEDYAQLGYLVDVDDEAETQKRRRGRGRPKKDAVVEAAVPDPSAEDNVSAGEEDDSAFDDEYCEHQKKRRRRSKATTTKCKKSTKTSKCEQHKNPKSNSSGQKAPVPQENNNNLQQIASMVRRGLPSSADDAKGFVANVYGYDYMQHVQVLHLDKKWYEGRLVRIDRNRVLVHYCGWADEFDEYIAVGSRRIQVIENDHEVECLEPDYRERYESNKRLIEQQREKSTTPEASQTAGSKRRQRRLSPSDVDTEVEYHKEPTNENEVEESDKWKVYCNQCNVIIKQFRYYCTYCETPSEGHDYQSFELCLQCFDQNFPFWHEHPRSSFAVQAVIDSQVGPMPIKGELVTVWEEDVIMDETNNNDDEEGEGEPAAGTIEASQVFSGTDAIVTAEEGYKFLKRWQRRKVCAFCNDDDDTSDELGKFIGPFLIATYNKNGVERKRQFWAHYACARYSPEVFCTPEGKWYNVTLALRRGRGMRCYACKEKGATIGCFDSRCNKSFHLPCSQKPVSYFKNGVIFWCPTHEAYYNKKDTYVNIFKCDGCQKKLEDESWFTCLPCASSYFSSFDLCSECFERFPEDHPHGQDDFEETSYAIIKEMEAQKAREAARAKENAAAKKRKKPLFPRRRRRRQEDGSVAPSCCYCGTQDADEWRKGYDGGVIMCRACFEMALLVDNSDGSGNKNEPLVMNPDSEDQQQGYATWIDDYTHKPYLTRDALSVSKFSREGQSLRLSSYEPQPHQLFSLVFDSTYYDIPGRAPRWATHSGTDYHGTWLPQTVRRAILKYTEKDERVLSNFLGRGTDAIECFLLQRKCCGVDINPAAVALSQRNCCFEIPPGLTSAEYRPIIAQADSRHLVGALFTDESFHHILSHPPYKDCVAYSTHLEGDLSRFTNIDEFKAEYVKVVNESWRLLKMGRRLTLGIGDNREHCFYIPVGFHLMRQYIDNGFELEELIIKRQRYCSAFGLGTYLCVQFDFLVFTHEFIATFRKIPKENVDRMMLIEDESCKDAVRTRHVIRGIPSSAIARKSVVMGTVWIFKPTEKYSFQQLCVSRMVERFGRDEANWEQVELDFLTFEQNRIMQLQETVPENHNPEAGQEEEQEEDDKEMLSEYERQRLKRIEENNRTLVKLGLLSELSEESTDVMHLEAMANRPAYPNAPLRLIVVAHEPNLAVHHINIYRQTLTRIARESVAKLETGGMLIVGTRDVRTPAGKLWPMAMLVLEDIERAVDSSLLKLKEMVVAVPDGYSKDRHQKQPEKPPQEEETDTVDIVDEHLPIVHAIYLVFQRL